MPYRLRAGTRLIPMNGSTFREADELNVVPAGSVTATKYKPTFEFVRLVRLSTALVAFGMALEITEFIGVKYH